MFYVVSHNLLHYIYIALLSTKSALRCQGVSPHPPSVCSIHLDDATAAIVHQNVPPHTSLLVERRPSEAVNQQIWGLLGGHDGQRPMGKFGQDAEVTPLLFFERHGILNDHRESGPRFNVSSEGLCFLQYRVPIIILGR